MRRSLLLALAAVGLLTLILTFVPGGRTPVPTEGAGERTTESRGADGEATTDGDTPDDETDESSYWDHLEHVEPPREPDRVTIVSASDGRPLPGAEIHVHAYETDTRTSFVAGGDGVALVRGRDRIVVRHVGFRPTHVDFDDLEEPYVVRLDPAPSLPGRVVRAGSGRPIAGARVNSWTDTSVTEDLDVVLVTDEEGRFVVAGVPADEAVHLAVVADGFGSVVERVLATERGKPVTIRLGHGGTIEGCVLDSAGKPVAGAEVFVAERGFDDPLRRPDKLAGGRYRGRVKALRCRTVSGPKGRYRFEGLQAPGEHLLFARAPESREGVSDPAVLGAPGDVVTRDLRLLALGAIRIRLVVGETSGDDVRIALDGDWYRDWHEVFLRRDDRETTIEGIRPGKHFLDVQPEVGALPMRVPVTVEEGETVDFPLVLEAGLSVWGRLVDRAGGPRRGYLLYTLRTDWGGTDVRATETDAEGRFRFDGLPPSPGDLEISSLPSYVTVAERKGVHPGRDLGRVLVPIPGRVVGRILGLESHRRTSVEVGHGLGASPAEDGRFEVELPPDVPCRLVITSGDRPAIVREGLLLAAGEKFDLGDLRFPEALTIEGIVLHGDGQPARGLEVGVLEGWAYRVDDVTDASGRFRLEGLGPGTITLAVRRSWKRIAYRRLEVDADAPPIRIVLPDLARLRVHLRDRRGKPLRRFPMNLWSLDAGGEPDGVRRIIVWTDSTGRAEERVPPGRYRLEVYWHRGEFVEPPAPFELGPGSDTDLDLVLR